MLQILDLFSGIGGFSLGLEKTGGFKTVAFCEVNEKARMVLAKHWPDTPIYNDVKEITNERLKAEGIVPDVITGGFPCQDISVAGKGEGLSGERSGLWFEFARIIREVGPRWVIIENVSILRSRGLLTILQNLSEIGYDAEWHCITASYVGAPHQRDRIWILGYPHGQQVNPVLDGSRSQGSSKTTSTRPLYVGNPSSRIGTQEQWSIEPDMDRVADGVPGRVDRLKQLGNSVVPQIPQLIGNCILDCNGR